MMKRIRSFVKKNETILGLGGQHELHIPPKEMQKLMEWTDQHSCDHQIQNLISETATLSPMLVEQFRLTLVPTGLGLIIEVGCVCGQRCDVTDYHSF